MDYEAGVTNYPVIGFVPDAYSTTLVSLNNLERSKYTKKKLLIFM